MIIVGAMALRVTNGTEYLGGWIHVDGRNINKLWQNHIWVAGGLGSQRWLEQNGRSGQTFAEKGRHWPCGTANCCAIAAHVVRLSANFNPGTHWHCLLLVAFCTCLSRPKPPFRLYNMLDSFSVICSVSILNLETSTNRETPRRILKSGLNQSDLLKHKITPPTK